MDPPDDTASAVAPLPLTSTTALMDDTTVSSGPIPPGGSNIKKNIIYRGPEPIINSSTSSASSESEKVSSPVSEQAEPAHPLIDDGSEMKTSRSVEIPSQILPNVNCVENIVICIDITAEMSERRYKARAGNSFSAMEIVKRALKLFISNKQMVSYPQNKHNFALVILLDQALWLHDFTCDVEDLYTQIDSLEVLESQSKRFDMTSLFDIIYEKAKPPLNIDQESIPPYIVRCVLIYGRSHCMPIFSSHISQNLICGSPCFFLDIIYLHEAVSQDNQSEGIYQELCELDVGGFSHIYDISKLPTRVFDAFGKLLAHPLQRAVQSQCGYKLEPVPVSQLGMDDI